MRSDLDNIHFLVSQAFLKNIIVTLFDFLAILHPCKTQHHMDNAKFCYQLKK